MRTISPSRLAAFRRTLRQAFESPSTQLLTRTLTTPGGSIKDAKILWRRDIGLWGHFRREPHDNRRWLCWYGLDPGLEGRPQRPAVEINLDRDPAYKPVSGRALMDPETGAFFLGHRGGLGGGRGGQMTIEAFRLQIRGFARDLIQLGADREEEVFVIGAPGEPDFLVQLQAYVAECQRLRALAREGRSAPGLAGPHAAAGGFRPECDQDGFLLRRPAELRAIKRRHGRVVNALQAQLGARAINSSHARMRPDLYIRGASGAMATLFEVKASSDTQSWFTALGQLVVYGADQPKPPRRILVCPAPLRDPAFAMALKALEVRLVTFEEGATGSIVFNGLEAAMK